MYKHIGYKLCMVQKRLKFFTNDNLFLNLKIKGQLKYKIFISKYVYLVMQCTQHFL